ncbi:hypothetical protein [Bifidobacterium choerinum]|uniref:hypothetical protein n=1 Tax=Bifidobacterium choerinum TaxID=35760 RepID=UPI002F97BCB7
MFGELDEIEFGVIIRHILRIARGSESHTWFVEKDDFASDAFNDGDWVQLLHDVARMATRHHVANLGHLIEIPALDWCDSPDYAAAFYGDFVLLFDLLTPIDPFNDEDGDDLSWAQRARHHQLVVPQTAVTLTYQQRREH